MVGVVIHNAFELWPRGQLFPDAGDITYNRSLSLPLTPLAAFVSRSPLSWAAWM
jgi:hypothetical protein